MFIGDAGFLKYRSKKPWFGTTSRAPLARLPFHLVLLLPLRPGYIPAARETATSHHHCPHHPYAIISEARRVWKKPASPPVILRLALPSSSSSTATSLLSASALPSRATRWPDPAWPRHIGATVTTTLVPYAMLLRRRCLNRKNIKSLPICSKFSSNVM